jgi:hypothetical protein
VIFRWPACDKWYVHPDPSVSPLLSNRIDAEEASVADFRSPHDSIR